MFTLRSAYTDQVLATSDHLPTLIALAQWYRSTQQLSCAIFDSMGDLVNSRQQHLCMLHLAKDLKTAH